MSTWAYHEDMLLVVSELHPDLIGTAVLSVAESVRRAEADNGLFFDWSTLRVKTFPMRQYNPPRLRVEVTVSEHA